MAGQDLSDLMRALAEDPALLAQVRGLVLGDAYARLPETLASIAERMGAVSTSQDRTVAHIAALVDAQTRTEDHLAALTARVDALTVQMEALTARVDALTVQMEALTVQVEALTEAQGRTEQRLDQLVLRTADLSGMALESRYRERAASYLQDIARRIHVLTPEELDDLLEGSMEAGTLSDDECREVRATDFVARGRRREDGAVVYLVVEVSWGVGVSDVERAARRAAILASAGIEALPVVAGASVIPDAERLARERGVRSVVDGVTSAVA